MYCFTLSSFYSISNNINDKSLALSSFFEVLRYSDSEVALSSLLLASVMLRRNRPDT